MAYLNRQRYAIFLLLLPAFAVFTLYICVPVVMSFYYSLTNASLAGPASFIGLHNFIILFTVDTNFAIALKNTFIIVGGSLVVMLPVAFLLAALLYRQFRGSNVFMALNVLPAVISTTIVGILWQFILDPHSGFLNALLRDIGLRSLALQWIGGPTLTPYTVAVINAWQGVGLMSVILIAGMRVIPEEILEASRIDGTTPFQQLTKVIIPMIKQSILMASILIVSGGFQVFAVILELTNGGPNNLSQSLTTYMYQDTFTSWQYGYGAAISVVIFVLTMSVSIFFIYLVNHNDPV